MLREREVEAGRGQTGESTHQLFTFTSVVAESSVQGRGVSCSIRQGGCSAPRRHPSARTEQSPVNGAGLRSIGAFAYGVQRQLPQARAGVDMEALRRQQAKRDPDRPIGSSLSAGANTAGIGSMTCV